MNTRIAVLAASAAEFERASALATRLQLPLVTDAQPPPGCVAWLCYRDGRLQLQPVERSQSGPICVDFCAGASAHRLQGGAELVVQALRGRSRQPLSVLDATAGLGRDSFVLAGRGLRVHMLEREPVIAALLADGLERARSAADPRIADTVALLSLENSDAVAYCAALAPEQRPDAIYLDPMFPATEKSALVKKEMRLFQQVLHGAVDDGAALLPAARAVARRRVVVKRPRKAEPLAGAKPDYSLEGRAVRFDVYLGGGER